MSTKGADERATCIFCRVIFHYYFSLFDDAIDGFSYKQDQFDAIDLSDNEIVKLENFPNLNRLGTLFLNNNRITRINPNVGGITMVIVSFCYEFWFASLFVTFL